MSGNSNEEAKREQRLRLLEDDIGRHLAESHASGELKQAASYGKPLNLGDGYEETPADLRMGYKILKDAGVVPPEVEFMQRIEAQRVAAEALPEGAERQAAMRRLADMRQQLAMRLEALGRRSI
jgi:Domain of unknown function (DUF1992)